MESGAITGKKANSSRKRQAKDDKPAALHKKRKGRLENLTNMPLDILFEIFSNLMPSDLLKLAVLNKEFRRILMSRTSISVWKAARFNANELPDPPADMSEPAWAYLAFTAICHLCGTAKVRKIDWAFRKRFCKICSTMELVIKPWDPVAGLLPTRMTRDGEVYVFLPQYTALSNERKLLEDKPDELKVFDQQKQLELQDILTHEKLCIDWEKQCSADKSDECNALRRQRYEAIVDKLRSLGWEKELALAAVRSELSNHKLVDQPTRLTPRIWSNIEKPLLEFMQHCRAYRLKIEKTKYDNDRKALAVSALRKFKIERLPYTELMPSSVDFCDFDIIKTVLTLPRDVTLDKSSFDTLIPLLSPIFEEWRTQKILELKEVLENGVPGGALDLAIAVFDCPQCMGMTGRPSESLEFYPDVLVHECTIIREYAAGCHAPDDVTVKLRRYAQPYAEYGRRTWSTSNLFVSLKNVEAVKHVVRAAGLDPMVTTVEQMDRGEMYFACETCFRHDSDVELFGWRVAVNHLLAVHSYDLSIIQSLVRSERGEQYCDLNKFDFEPIKWKIVSTASISHLNIEPSPIISKRWRCVHCMDLSSEIRPGTLQYIRAHLAAAHQITTPIENQDYFTPFPPQFETISSNRLVMKYGDL